jgi:hypothetical protein
MKDQMGARLVYQNAKDALRKALSTGSKPLSGMALEDAISNAVMSQSYLRVEQPLVETTTQFKFPILVNQGTQRLTEQRLNLQDCFYVSEMGVYLSPASSATSIAMPLYTYPNSVAFPNGGAGVDAPYYAFYTGSYKLTINGSVIITALDLDRFQMIPQTQQTAATNSPITERYGSGNLSAQCVSEPNVLFVGSKKNDIEINLPVALTAIDSFVFIVIIYRGVLMQNVTVVS